MKKRFFALVLCLAVLCPRAAFAKTEKWVALTFDDGPSGRYTRRLLDGLKEREVKATFLLCGYRLREFPRIARRIYEEGHEIGLHGYSHKNMGKMSVSQVKKELDETRDLLPEGCEPVFFRPPGGVVSESVKKASAGAGLAILGWSVDPKDWAVHDANSVQATVLGNVEDGDIILLHDMCDSSVDAALAIVDKLHEWGFRVVTASELAARRNITPQPGVLYFNFR